MRPVPARAAFLGAVFAALVTLPGLGNGTLWDNSETTYGEVAREILITHDWVVMHLNLQPWFVQPPLYFWVAALLAKLFGVAPFAVRLPSALATIVMGAAVGAATARIAGVRAGAVAAIVLSTSLMQAVVGRLAIMDALLDLFVALAILWWFRAFEPSGPPARRDAAFLWGCVALALGMLAKGPVAPVVALLVVVPWLAWERAAGAVAAPRPRALAGGALAFLAVALPWFALLVARVGAHGIATLIGTYTVGRYTGVIENQTGPVWYYVPVLILGFFPWIAFLPVAVRAAIREARDRDGAFARLAFTWAILPVVFFSFANTKLPNYVALMFPALAILVALWFERVAAGAERRAAIWSAAAIPIFVAALAIAIALFTRNNDLGSALRVLDPALAGLAIAIVAGSAITVAVIARPSSAAAAPAVLGVTMAVLMLVVAIVVEPVADALKPVPPLAAAIDARRTPEDVVAIGDVSGAMALMFYTRPPVVSFTGPNQSYVSAICPFADAWIVDRLSAAPALVRLATSLQRTAAVVATSPASRPSDALIHVGGKPCPTDFDSR